MESEETAARVQRAIAALPERQRMAIILHRFEELSYQEIAHITGWGEAAIESLLSRAYASLRTQLSDLKISS
jgi:RNA polymerase sigma-70 factor (ECF subfamily)